MKDEQWTKKDGSKIMVGDMSEGHVRATLRMLLRNNRKLREAQWTGADEGDRYSIY